MSESPDRIVDIFRSLDEVPNDFGPTVVAIGNFDGVHRGHREILAAVVAEAQKRGVRSAAITFDPHPEKFLRPKHAPKLLTPMAERLRLLTEIGMDAVIVLPFDAALASQRARQFVEQALVNRLRVLTVHEGGNFRFGRNAEAGVDELVQFGAEFGFGVQLHTSVRVHGLGVSSSKIRRLVAAGDMKRARWMLGRPFSVYSTPAKGRGIGTKLLVPTINLAAYEELLPAIDVYVTQLTVGSRCFEAVTNVGNRPTFEGAGFGVETHILNFEPVDLSDETPLKLEFLFRLRGEMTWPSPDALKAQIFKDVAKAKRYFRLLAGAS